MPIEIVAAPSGKGDKKKSGANPIELMFFIALNLLVIPFSGYQTYVGFQGFLGEAPAFVVAAISAVLFAAMNLVIRERRLEGKPHHWQTIFYIVPLGLSFIGNFNAFYSQQMQNELYDKEVTVYESVLEQTYSNAKSALDSSTGLAPLETSKNAQLNSLKDQFDGRTGTPGWADGCEKDWKTLKTLLEAADSRGSKISEFNRGISDKDKMNSATYLANSYFDALAASKRSQIRPIVISIDSIYSSIAPRVALAKKGNTLSQEGRELLNGLVTANNQIGFKAKGHLRGKFSYRELQTSDHNQIGAPKHTLKSAFVDWERPTATFLSVFFSLIIDLCALLYILVFVPFNTTGGRLSIGPRRI